MICSATAWNRSSTVLPRSPAPRPDQSAAPQASERRRLSRVEAFDCPMSSCAAPAGAPCRTGRGKMAARYHIARFRLVPSMPKVLNVPTPAQGHRRRHRHR
ncbi:zinc finger domain-containing protein [Nonomuraea angiospora]|uniref:zinc finger domain-containing protein n=1 Tax=Nonomuraea angiospora TaxID=46172 RepID=UPI003EBDF251